MKLRICLACLLAVALALPPLFSRAQQRGQEVRLRIGADTEVKLYEASYALVIGVSDYTNGWSDLPGVRDDVPVVKAALEAHGFTVLTLLNPTRMQLDEKLRDFIGKYGQSDGHRLLVYYAGHGHTLKSGTGAQQRELGYLVPADAPLPRADTLGEFKRLAISMSQMQSYIEQIETRHALFVFDSCFAGTIFKARDNPVPEPINDKIIQPVRQFIAAGTATQKVLDQSPFRRAFVAGLAGAADTLRDGFITGTELGEYLHSEVTTVTKRAQTPQHGKSLETDYSLGDLVFRSPKRESVVLVEPPRIAPADRCALAWDAIKSSENETTLQNFIAECKDAPQWFAANLRLNDVRARRPGVTNPPATNPGPPALTPVMALPAGVPVSALRSASFTTAKVDANARVTRPQAGPVQFYEAELGGGVKLIMVAVPGGRFQMGSTDAEIQAALADRKRSDANAKLEWYSDEGPQHWVRLSDFWIGRYEVTQGQWKAVMGALPPNMNGLGNEFKGDDLPVVNVSWEEAKQFCEKLDAKLNLPKGSHRLPYEAEWEYAARAGTQTPFGFGVTITPELENYWWNNPYGKAPQKEKLGHPVRVGSYVANPFGLFDMHGNVWEWCEDWYGSYPSSEVSDPKGASTGSSRVSRGGGWGNSAVNCRSAYRAHDAPGYRFGDLGVRLVRT